MNILFFLPFVVLGQMLLTARLAESSQAVSSQSPRSFEVCALDSGCRPAGKFNTVDERAQTRYPVVLVHGMMGSTVNPKSGFNYWGKIPELLARHGTDVYLVKQSALNSSEVRGEQLLQQVQEVIRTSGQPKVHLISHSQGGLSARYVMAVAPQLVASVTTIASPHQGALAADRVKQLAVRLTPAQQRLAIRLANTMGKRTNRSTGSRNEEKYPQDALAALNSVTTEGTAAFNRKYPAGLPSAACGDGPASVGGIPLFSWSGTGQVTNRLHWDDYVLASFNRALHGIKDGDGIVERCSSHFGQVLNDHYPWNHLDEVDILYTENRHNTPAPAQVILQHVERLKQLGL